MHLSRDKKVLRLEGKTALTALFQLFLPRFFPILFFFFVPRVPH